MPLLTIFTPAYNRAHTLPRTYASLLSQKNKDFIWLIVDDGSNDGTAELIRDWQSKDSGFAIHYVYKENGGMHTAHNVAYEKIDTELNVCIDSDDALAEDAVEIILSEWEKVRHMNLAGLMGLDADFSGRIIGTKFPEDKSTMTATGFYAMGGTGDKKLVYRTDVIKGVPPYPVFEGEKYVALAYKYRLIDQQYKMLAINKVLCNVEYQADGSSNTMWHQYLKNPKGFAFWRVICMQYPTTQRRMLIDVIHYCSSSILGKNPRFIVESPKKLLTAIASPFGLMLAFITRMKGRA